VKVVVQDSGEGIAEDDREQVFERFYRGEKSRSREFGGSGLGLSIARGIVQAHGGRIWVEGGPGGATVAFTIPAA
jgi:signal transduction histidine kinase